MTSPANCLPQTDEIRDLGDLTRNQQRLLAIILNPTNDTAGFYDGDTPAEIAEEIEDSFGSFTGYDSYAQASQIADALHAHYNYRTPANPDGGAGDFTFGFECNSEGEISGYEIGIYLGHSRGGIYLSKSQETKYLANGNRDATGLQAALGYAEVLDGDYQWLLGKARDLGLLPPETPQTNHTETGRPDPQAARQALAAYDATPEGEDIDADTLAAVRDALAAYIAADTTHTD